MNPRDVPSAHERAPPSAHFGRPPVQGGNWLVSKGEPSWNVTHCNLWKKEKIFKIFKIPDKLELHHWHMLACCHHCMEILWLEQIRQHRHNWVWYCPHMGWDEDDWSHSHWHKCKLVCLHLNILALGYQDHLVCQVGHHLLQILQVFELPQPRQHRQLLGQTSF